jgi:hypothetical protein
MVSLTNTSTQAEQLVYLQQTIIDMNDHPSKGIQVENTSKGKRRRNKGVIDTSHGLVQTLPNL